MTNYQLGKIYRIIDNETGKEYIGSTCEPTLARRLAGHKRSYKSYKNGKGVYMTSFITLENGNFEIFLIENFPCNSKDELHQRERFFIEQNEGVNKNIPNRKPNEYYIDNKVVRLEYQKAYQIENKQNISEYQKQYQTENKDVILEKAKEYYTDNKENKKEQRKAYQIANKQKLKEKRKIYYQKIKALKQSEKA